MAKDDSRHRWHTGCSEQSISPSSQEKTVLIVPRPLALVALAAPLFSLNACGTDHILELPADERRTDSTEEGISLTGLADNAIEEGKRYPDIFTQCRQPLPGIAPYSEENNANFDDSSLGTSQQFQISGSGDWDDNANYRRFQDLVSRAPVHETVDVSNRQYVVVLDEDEKGVANCPVTLSDAEGRTATLTTLASGRLALFPQLYGFEGPLQASAQCLSTSATATVSLAKEDGVTVVHLDAAREKRASATLDLAFVLDVTGSMSAEIEAMKETIDAVASQIVSANESKVRLALVAYRDYGDVPEFEVVDFTTDLELFRAYVEGLEAQGGGDAPEAVNEALHRATTLDWNPAATARMAFVIGDAPPHAQEQYSAVRSAAVLACGGVKTFTVATTGQSLDGRYIFRQVSQMTQATHLFLLRGESGSESECSNQEFRTDDLHSLVIGKARGELASVNDDPLDIPGLVEDRDLELSAALDKCAREATQKARAEAEAAGLDPDSVGDFLPVVK